MTKSVANILTGEFPEITTKYETQTDGKIKKIYECENKSIIAGDTDSVYFKIIPEKEDDNITSEQAIEIADGVGEYVNSKFPGFMEREFCCTEGYKELITCEREVVADVGIFLARKRYALKCINVDGYDIEAGSKKEIKTMGLDAKKSDTPKYIQNFLNTMMFMILKGKSYKEIDNYVNDFRVKFHNEKDVFQFGVTKSVNKLDFYQQEYDNYEKAGIKRARLPGNVRAAINHNEYIQSIDDKTTMPLIDEQKIRIFYLKFNDDKFKSIAISGDEDMFPKWFDEEFEVDMKLTEEKLIDKKIQRIFNVIGWEIPTEALKAANDVLEF